MDTTYSLFQYLIHSTQKEISSTFFFWGEGVPIGQRVFFASQSYTIPSLNWKPWNEVFLLFYFYYFYFPIKFRFVLSEKHEYWGCSHVLWAPAVFRRHDYYLLEDGLLNYVERSKGRFSWLKNLLFGPTFRTTKYVGEEKTCKSIFLTGLISSDILKLEKVIIRKLSDIWGKMPINQREYIFSVFDVKEEDVSDLLLYDRILVTQPLSEDSVPLMSEMEKVDFYKRIVDIVGTERLIIKPHPRELTEYEKVFPGIRILNAKVPLELLFLMGINFQYAYSAFSTALFNMPQSVKLCFFYNRNTKAITSKIVSTKKQNVILTEIM